VEQDEIIQHFQDTGALLDGHFLLSSGLHSAKYLQCALALQLPRAATQFGKAIAAKYRDAGINMVASPAIGGLVIGFAVATALGVRFIWTERQNGEMTVRRGFNVCDADRILVVEDVITTGGSTRECIAALTKHGANIVAAASIIDRSNGSADVGIPRKSLLSLDVPSYAESECPLCAGGDRPIKPGSRA
jgi:orotate phosphoribosyltransferase